MGKLTTMREAYHLRAVDAPSARVLLVGESNPYGGPDSNALLPWPDNCAGHRLQAKIFGLPEDCYTAMHRRNLCRGSWSIQAARSEAWSLISATGAPKPYRTIVMLGRKVHDAFARYQLGFTTTQDAAPMQPFTSRVAQGFTLIALPHPSGRNAASWAGDAIARARALLSELEPEIPWGSLG